LVGEIVKKIAHAWIIAVAQHNFVFKMVFIMSEFVFYVGKLRIKLVVFFSFRFV